jgi:membrane-bound metal-dependent hydrolase YbcI (DUF457 family)
MFHSLPAAIIACEFAFLLAPGEDVKLRVYTAVAVLLGYMSHLLLDEVYSLKMQRGRLRLKKSFGSAVKVFSSKLWPNVSTYLKLAILTFLVLKEPGWMQRHYQERIRPAGQSAGEAIEQVADSVVDRVIR